MTPRLLALAAVSALLATAAAAAHARERAPSAPVCAVSCFAAPAGSGALLMFSGHGWGHGVGMSQYGAFGYAQHGWTYEQILAHYYPGTTPGTLPGATIRVLLADRRKTLTLSSSVPWTVRDGNGARHTLAAGAVTLDAGLSLAVDGQTAPQPLAPPLTFSPGPGGPLTLARPYRGKIQVDLVGGTLRAVDIVGLEQYLYGVVPAEMSSTWAPEALKAQAVAARSYALATRLVGAPYDEYADARSQLYLGLSAESPATTAAVDATRHQVLLFAGKVATTYFFSSSGGETASIADAWGVPPLPYLVSVPDPYDVISPFHDWGPVPVTAQTIANRLKVPGTIMAASTTLNGSGRVGLLDLLTETAVSTIPVDTAVPAAKVQAALGLRSTWFDVGILSLAAPVPSPPIAYGSSIALTGLVQGVDGVMLEQRTPAGPWQSIGPVVPAADGTVQLTEQPTATTDYRLATAAAAAAYVRVKVTPVVTLATTATVGTVAGTELPILAGAPVQVQQQGLELTWTTIATGTVAPDGSFSVPVQLAPGGTYQVVVGPVQGYSPGATAPFTATG
ncbi:MAG TPA: SpoIID/LytB domain-containing protein [Gaiellaceae bacterium]|nr:SpoIID/LytB domain-containing protein [Gaiellaceae bacterium]